ncbi:MAG TPA: hypothetical protein VLW85_11965 [Myxococcales bacterium]|nr:hypothetical protein [Myxococcales bacterium]
MPGCNIEREVIGSIAWYRVGGRFEGAGAWDLAGRLESEPLGEAVVDFSQVADFSDYGIAVMANAIQGLTQKHVELRGLRLHQEHVFRCFGVDPESARRAAAPIPLPGDVAPASNKVA